MEVLFRPASLAMFGVAVAAALLRQPPLFVLALLLWVAIVAIQTFQDNGKRNSIPDLADLSSESRILVRPIRELREQIARLVDQNSDVASVKVVGGEALNEADKIVAHAIKLGELRSELKKTLRGRSEAEVSLSNLRDRLPEAATDEERSTLQSAIEAHHVEINHYKTVEASVAAVDSRLRQTEAAMSELKTRIAVGAAGARTEAMKADELTDMVTRLKSLSTSFGEAEAMLQDHVK